MKIKVNGMACAHCKASVEKALNAIEGVTGASADFHTGEVAIEGNPDIEKVRAAIEDIGFEYAGKLA